jgi:cell division protein FtsQ
MQRLIPILRSARAAGPNPRRRQQKRALLRRWAWRVGVPVLALGVVTGAGLWALQSGWLGRQGERVLHGVHATTADLGLAVGDVLVEGRNRTGRADVLAALGVGRGTPILALDAADARDRLEALPWVGSAVVERRLPDIVYVRLAEREPMANWQLRGRLQVIGRDGMAIRGAEPGRFAHLPLVVGPGAPEHTPRLLAALRAEPEMAPRVEAAVRVGERRWNIRLKNGVDVQLPEENVTGAWSQLARLERRHRVLQRDVRVIDLRLPGRMVVRMAPGAKPSDDTPGRGESA